MLQLKLQNFGHLMPQKGVGHRSSGWTEVGTRPAGRVYFLWPPTATRDWGPAGDQMFLS